MDSITIDVSPEIQHARLILDQSLNNLSRLQRDDFYADCKKHLVSLNAYHLWREECHRAGGIVHGQHRAHWEQAFRRFTLDHPGGFPTEGELIAYFKHKATEEVAYSFWLDRLRRSGQTAMSNPESDWTTAEREIEERFALLSDRILTGQTEHEETYRLLSCRISPPSDGSRGEPIDRFWDEITGVSDADWKGDGLMAEVDIEFRVAAAKRALEQSQGPFEGMSPEEVEAKYSGQKLALDSNSKIIECAETEEQLRKKMEAYPGKWRLHPGWPKAGRIELVPL